MKKFSQAPEGGKARPGMGPAEEVLALDQELIRLLTRRSALLRKLRGGKLLASTPAASALEKRLRRGWESVAGGLSRNPRFVRDLFDLLQELDLQAQTGESSLAPFNLAPARLPVETDLPGPALETSAQLWLALASAAGRNIMLEGAVRADGLQDSIRAFTWCGTRTEWHAGAEAGQETLEASGPAAGLDLGQGAVLVGDDALTLYLLIFLGLGRPGRARFVGGTRLKAANLAALAHFIPELGARLAWVVPGSKGLPATLECSGMLPENLKIPGDLPLEAISALLLAALAWPAPCLLDLQDLTPETRRQALAPLRPIFGALGGGAPQERGTGLAYPGIASLPDLPARVALEMDQRLCAFWLCLPLFTGGSVRLRGPWPQTPLAADIRDLLGRLPLSLQEGGDYVSCTAAPAQGWPERLELERLDPDLHPLFWALNARLAHKNKGAAIIRNLPEGMDFALAEEFLAQAGFSLERDDAGWRVRRLDTEAFKERAAKKHGWSSPSPGWALALSLAAFLRSNLKLHNPDCVRAVWPDYWQIYNQLPGQSPQTAASTSPAPIPPRPPARRRILADEPPLN
ncbi:MAG: hypothetical protein FWF99_03865 [Desulfovibrionaceae bacterium]|nr:hypothetical protein [Desulfovibrionaceae bacterium]